jgi:hypothetical protein
LIMGSTTNYDGIFQFWIKSDKTNGDFMLWHVGRPVAKKRVDKHGFHGGGFLGTNSVRNTFPWILEINKNFLEYGYAIHEENYIRSTTEYSGILKPECPVEEDDSVSDGDLWPVVTSCIKIQ